VRSGYHHARPLVVVDALCLVLFLFEGSACCAWACPRGSVGDDDKEGDGWFKERMIRSRCWPWNWCNFLPRVYAKSCKARDIFCASLWKVQQVFTFFTSIRHRPRPPRLISGR